MGIKLKSDISESFSGIKKRFWPSVDDAAQSIYDNATDEEKEMVETRISPIIYSYARKALTVGIALGIAATIWYASGCNDKSTVQDNTFKTEYSKNL